MFFATLMKDERTPLASWELRKSVPILLTLTNTRCFKANFS